jgi:hypothetical protein
MALVVAVMAHERQVTGTVYEPDGVTPVSGPRGAEGYHNRHQHDARGAYSIRVAGASPVLEIQSLDNIKQDLALVTGMSSTWSSRKRQLKYLRLLSPA